MYTYVLMCTFSSRVRACTVPDTYSLFTRCVSLSLRAVESAQPSAPVAAQDIHNKGAESGVPEKYFSCCEISYEKV